jgi:serine/threonine protein kinase
MQSKIQLLRQISHGMGYLHAKGIVVKNLNTRNIFLCSTNYNQKALFYYFILWPSVMLDGLSCSLTSISFLTNKYDFKLNTCKTVCTFAIIPSS